MKRETLQRIIRWLMVRLARLTFIGMEYLPKEGGVIIATNHLSRIDIPVLFMIPTRPDITALVTDKYKAYPIIRWFTTTAHGIWIDRTKADFTAFRVAIDALKEGKALGISPEGTRSTTGGLIPGKQGTVLLALKSKMPIVPVGLVGTAEMLPTLAKLRKPEMIARFGPMFTLPELEREDREGQLQRMTDEVMCRIAAVLPENLRGVYADHPRLTELLAEQANLQPSSVVLN